MPSYVLLGGTRHIHSTHSYMPGSDPLKLQFQPDAGCYEIVENLTWLLLTTDPFLPSHI